MLRRVLILARGDSLRKGENERILKKKLGAEDSYCFNLPTNATPPAARFARPRLAAGGLHSQVSAPPSRHLLRG